MCPGKNLFFARVDETCYQAKNSELSLNQYINFPWSGIRESNPRLKFGKLAYYHCTNPAKTSANLRTGGFANRKPTFARDWLAIRSAAIW